MNEKPDSGRGGASLADFSGLVGRKFNLRLSPSAVVEAELDSATKLTPGGPARSAGPLEREPFSLIFCLPLKSPVAQRVYALEHPAMGWLEIFLVPVALDGRGLRLQAVFN
jgi:hypothetical protein